MIDAMSRGDNYQAIADALATASYGDDQESIPLKHGGAIRIIRLHDGGYGLQIERIDADQAIVFTFGVLTAIDLANLADACLVISEDDRAKRKP